jgi:hypothetical protein
LAQVLRTSTHPIQVNRQPLGQPSQGPYDHSAHNFEPTPRILQHDWIGEYAGIEQDIGASLPVTKDPPQCSIKAGHKVDIDPELQGYPRSYHLH